MAIALVGTGTNVGSGLSSLAVTRSGATSGNGLVLMARWVDSAATISSVACGGESNLTLIGSPQIRDLGFGGVYNLQLAYLSNLTSNADKTVTVTFSESADGIGLWLGEFSGGDTTDFYDGVEAGASAATVGITTNTAGAMLIGQIADNGGEPTEGTGYTAAALANIFWWEHGQYDLDVGAAGAKTFDFTAAGTSVIKCAAFKPAGGGGGATLRRYSLSLTGLG